MKLASFLAFSTLLLSIQAVKYFRGNDIYGNEITNPNIASTPSTINSGSFSPDGSNAPYFDTNSQGNTGNLAGSNFGSYYGSGQLYPNLFSLTLGAQNYGNSGGLSNTYNFDGNAGQFAVDNSGGNLNDPTQNGVNSNFNTQNVYGANLYPGLSDYSNLGSPSAGIASYSSAPSGGFAISNDY